MNLSDLKLDEIATINSVRDGKIKSRLYDMGLKVGSKIKVFAVAPFGTPLGIKCGNIRLAIAKSVAEKITVKHAE